MPPKAPSPGAPHLLQLVVKGGLKVKILSGLGVLQLLHAVLVGKFEILGAHLDRQSQRAGCSKRAPYPPPPPSPPHL